MSSATKNATRAREVDANSVLGRAAMIVNAFDNGKPVLTLTEITTITGLPRSTVHRFAEQLIAIGWLERAASGYRVGTRLFEVGSRSERLDRLRRAANPWMFRLHEASRLTVHLAVLDGDEILYVDKIAARGHSLPSRVGHRMDAHCTALGRAMIAHTSATEIERVVHSGLQQHTPHTATTPSEFRAKLDDVLHTGVAVDDEEAVAGNMCVAAPIRGSGRAVAAISITGPRADFDLKRHATNARTAASGIWNDLFGTAEQATAPNRNPVSTPPRAPSPQASIVDPWAAQVLVGDWI